MVVPSLTPAAPNFYFEGVVSHTHTHGPVLAGGMWLTLVASPVRYTPAVQCHKTEPKRTPARTREPDHQFVYITTLFNSSPTSPL